MSDLQRGDLVRHALYPNQLREVADALPGGVVYVRWDGGAVDSRSADELVLVVPATGVI